METHDRGNRDFSLIRAVDFGKEYRKTVSIRADVWQRGIVSASMATQTGIYILLARILQPEGLGSYLFAQWLAMVMVAAIGAGVSTRVSRRLAALQSREAPSMIAGVFYFLWYRQHLRIFYYAIIYSILIFPLSILLRNYNTDILLLAGLATLPLLLGNVAGITLRSLRCADLLALLNLFGSLLTLLLVIVATQINGVPIEGFLLACALANTVTLTLAIICVTRLIPLTQARQPGFFLRERLYRCLKHSRLQFLLDAIVWQRCEFLLLAYWRTPEEIGLYGMSTLISAGIIGLVPYLFSNWLLPLQLHVWPNHHSHDPYDAFVKTSCYLVFLSVPICTVLILFCPQLISISLGNAYLPMIQPVRVLLIAAVFGSIATLSVTQLTNSEQEHVLTGPNMGIALCKLLLTIPLVITWGITGAAVASAITQSASALTAIILCSRHLKRGLGKQR